MDAKLKADWVTALRSGEYRQTTGALRAGKGYCCLGVLCRVARINIAKNGKAVSHGRDYDPIKRIVGLTMNELMGMNDRGATFPTIAKYIEANL